MLKTKGEEGLEDYLTTIPESHTIPVRKTKAYYNAVSYMGSDPIIELKDSTIFLKDIRFEKGDGTIINFTDSNPNLFKVKVLFKEYPYDDMLKVYIWFENTDLGLAQGRIIPMPAFALKAFHKGISDEITVLDVINKAVEIIGIVIPYIKLIELVQIGSKWYKIVEGGIALFAPITANFISSPAIDKALRSSDAGLKFLQGYNYLSFIYGTKDLKGLAIQISKGNFLAFKDGENLMTIWSTFVAPPDFIILLFLFNGCKSTNELNVDDYKILQIAIQNCVTVSFSVLKNDKSLSNLIDGTEGYKEKINELYLNQNYESDYYFSLDETLFTYKDNWYVQELFSKNNFKGNIKNLIPLKIDYSKVKTKKHLIRVNKNSEFAKSSNYIGDYKFSRIMYDGNKAVILMENNGRLLMFLEKKNNEWVVYKQAGIPYELYEKKIDL